MGLMKKKKMDMKKKTKIPASNDVRSIAAARKKLVTKVTTSYDVISKIVHRSSTKSSKVSDKEIATSF
jgi:hypothetical protein